MDEVPVVAATAPCGRRTPEEQPDADGGSRRPAHSNTPARERGEEGGAAMEASSGSAGVEEGAAVMAGGFRTCTFLLPYKMT